jgi:two-component system, NtrC family, sensor kinase
MRLFHQLPIRRRLTVTTMVICAAALLLSAAAFLVYDRIIFRETLLNGLLSTAQMAGYNSAAALAFGEPGSAEQTLQSLRAYPNITGAAIYQPDGTVFATYQVRKGFVAPPLSPDGHRFAGGHLLLSHPIALSGERLGTILLVSDLAEMRARFWRYTFIVIIVTAGASLLALWLSRRLQRGISEPVAHLAEVAHRVAADRDYSLRAVKQSDDELGRLIEGFNEMLAQIQLRDRAVNEARETLEQRVRNRTSELLQEITDRKQAEADLAEAHRQLVDASRQAGMAEVATGVLHNVGNVLNSVNVSATLVSDGVRHSKLAGIKRLSQLLDEHQDDLARFLAEDSRGRQIPGYVRQLSAHLEAEQTALLRELDGLKKNIEHIKDIVAMQQDYARISGARETVAVASLVEDALSLNAGALSRHEVRVIRDYADVPQVNVDRHKVLQIMVNLVRNAKYACDEPALADRRLTVQIRQQNGHVQIRVCDNGVGIPRENLTRIFNHGFTTRKEGHGFGLHSAALAAKELGGSLFAHSDGPGQGANFTLELPLDSGAAGPPNEVSAEPTNPNPTLP